MVNNVAITAGAGTTMRSDDAAGVHYPYVKLADGTEDATTVIAAGNGVAAGALRVTLSSDGTGVILPGTGATNIGKAEDAAHTTGDVGVMALAVRNDAGTALAGTTGDYAPLGVDASGNLYVNVASGTLTIANGADPLTVGGKVDVMNPTITVSTTPAYSIGDVVGGRIQLASALGTLRTGMLQSIVVSFAGALSPALDIMFFDSQPTQNTLDNAAFAWDAADDAKFLWKQSVESVDYYTVPGATARTFACVAPFTPMLKSSGSADLWMYVVTRAAFTATATTSFRVKPGIAKD